MSYTYNSIQSGEINRPPQNHKHHQPRSTKLQSQQIPKIENSINLIIMLSRVLNYFVYQSHTSFLTDSIYLIM